MSALHLAHPVSQQLHPDLRHRLLHTAPLAHHPSHQHDHTIPRVGKWTSMHALQTQPGCRPSLHSARSICSGRVVLCQAKAGYEEGTGAGPSRRAALLALMVAAPMTAQALPAMAYGGRKQLTAMDAGESSRWCQGARLHSHSPGGGGGGGGGARRTPIGVVMAFIGWIPNATLCVGSRSAAACMHQRQFSTMPADIGGGGGCGGGGACYMLHATCYMLHATCYMSEPC